MGAPTAVPVVMLAPALEAVHNKTGKKTVTLPGLTEEQEARIAGWNGHKIHTGSGKFGGSW